MSKVLSVKLDEEKLKIIDEIAKEEKSDRSSVTRKLLELGIKQWMIEKAIQLVLSGKVSVWKASQIAQVSLREFLDILHERKISWIKISPEEIERELKWITKKKD